MDSTTSEISNKFKRFWTNHENNNRFLWSTRVAMLFTRGYIEGHNINPQTTVKSFVRDNLKGQWRTNINLKHYKGPYIEENDDRPELIVEHLMNDLEHISSDCLYHSIIVNEIRALELLINGVFETISSYILAKNSTDNENKESIKKILQRINSNERYSVSLKQVCSLLPNIAALLNGTTYKREANPFLSTKVHCLSCMDVVSMWKEIRNIIVHHDLKATPEFSKRWSKMFLTIMTANANNTKVISPGGKVVIRLRETMFCMTTCYQTAVVLSIALGCSK